MTNIQGECYITDSKDDEVDALGQHYAEYLHLDASQQTKHFDDSIEELLTRLDEYHGLLDMVRSDTSLCLQKNIPLIKAKNAEMEKMFERIDKLEAFVAVVQRSISDMDEMVDKAEADLGSFSSIRKAFGSIPLPSFLASKKTSPTKRVASYTAPVLYKTKEYIVSSVSKKQTNSMIPQPTLKDDTESNNVTMTHTYPDVGTVSAQQVKTEVPEAHDCQNTAHNPESIDPKPVGQSDSSYIPASTDSELVDQSDSTHSMASTDPEPVIQSDSAENVESITVEPVGQSDSGFQSPVHLEENHDVRSKES